MATSLNEMQQLAVEHKDGPLLILAGAGSGKTSVLTKRAAYLINEYGVDPYHIMAITFTNKAAGEMKERIGREVGPGAESIWCATFHSSCVRILRRYIDRLGYDSNFTIYDTEDQKKLMKDILKRENIDPKQMKERAVLSAISSAKDKLLSPAEYCVKYRSGYYEEQIGRLYRIYQSELKKNNALDFDDLIFKTVELFQDHQDVLRNYQERFHYIMVDEYQDTNIAQFELIRLLADRYHNLCVVGDDDQSIYKFRGANLRNILDFEKNYPDATVIRLEQNYRSTQTILDAANAVIQNNIGRKGKTLWTGNDQGEKINFVQYETAFEEAESIAGIISRSVMTGGSYSDFAILYRTNAQSRLLEEKLLLRNIPYKLVGGVNFYSRKEVKDLLAYLKIVENARDDLAVSRILNVPKRGIGATTENRVRDYAAYNDISFFEALKIAKDIPGVSRGAAKIEEFTDLIATLQDMVDRSMPSDILSEIIERTGYVEELRAEGTDEAKSRIENVDELFNKVVDYEDTADEPTLSGFLQEVSLVADLDNLVEDQNYVVLMTLHAAKGLEFNTVFLTGMEDGLFPGFNSITSPDPDDLEEERRLAYVGITRARKHLMLSAAKCRMNRGDYQYNAISRFVREIPEEIINGYMPKNRYEREVSSMSEEKNKPIEGVGYGRPKVNQNYAKKPYENPYSKDFGSKDAGELGYGVGDRVKHIKFGEGTVTDIVSGGRDFEVTVEFDGAGSKKLFATLAKLKKL